MTHCPMASSIARMNWEIENAPEMARQCIADSIKVVETSATPDMFLGCRHDHSGPDHDMKE